MKSNLSRAFAALLTTAAVLCCGAAATAPINAPLTTQSAPTEAMLPSYEVPLYKSVTVRLNRPAKRVSIANPGIADILATRSQEVYVVGKLLGSTSVTAWDDSGNAFSTFSIEVTHDLETLKTKLHELLPDENIKVYSAQYKLVLAGQVSSIAHMDAAMQLAAGFLPAWVPNQSDAPGNSQQVANREAKSGCDEICKKGMLVNLMQVGGANQVMLKVTVAEVQRSLVKELNSQLNIMNFGSRFTAGGVSGGATFPNAIPSGAASNTIIPTLGGTTSTLNPIGPPMQIFQPNNPTIGATGTFLSYLSGNLFIEEVLDVSKTNGLARILSEPTLTTLTGQEAQFLSGGEFPIPVPQGGASNAVTIDYKKFGVNVKFLPTVLDSGRINLSVAVTVSQLSSDNNVAFTVNGTTSTFIIPSLTERSASSAVELADGQTMGIAGLINDNMQGSIQKFPGIGEVPLLGQLFASQKFQSGQTELVMFVTPHLAAPIGAKQLRLPTDGFVPPGDIDFYLLGKLEGKRSAAPAPTGTSSLHEEAPKGSFGHDVSSAP
jgi:pilus assembly protein CpaC